MTTPAEWIALGLRLVSEEARSKLDGTLFNDEIGSVVLATEQRSEMLRDLLARHEVLIEGKTVIAAVREALEMQSQMRREKIILERIRRVSRLPRLHGVDASGVKRLAELLDEIVK